MERESNVYSIIKKGYVADLEFCFDVLAKMHDAIKREYPSGKISILNKTFDHDIIHGICVTINDGMYMIKTGITPSYWGTGGVPTACINVVKKDIMMHQDYPISKYCERTNITDLETDLNSDYLTIMSNHIEPDKAYIKSFVRQGEIIADDNLIDFIRRAISDVVHELKPDLSIDECDIK